MYLDWVPLENRFAAVGSQLTHVLQDTYSQACLHDFVRIVKEMLGGCGTVHIEIHQQV